jgi:hypothetical protein
VDTGSGQEGQVAQVMEQALYKMWDETQGGRSEVKFIVPDQGDKVDVPGRQAT